MGEIKQTNFRIDQETADAFRHFCEEHGMNQAQGFDHIMQVVELDRAKAVTPGRVVEIERFEKSVKDILAAYLNSLAINNDAEDRIREQFASALDQKNREINDLKAQIVKLNESLDSAETYKKYADEKVKRASDLKKINDMLNMQLTDAVKKLSGYEKLKLDHSELQKKLKETEENLETKIRSTENELAKLKMQSELSTEKAVSDKEREMNQLIMAAEKESAKLSAQNEELRNQVELLKNMLDIKDK